LEENERQKEKNGYFDFSMPHFVILNRKPEGKTHSLIHKQKPIDNKSPSKTCFLKVKID